MEDKEKEPWEMTFDEIVKEIGDGTLEHLNGDPVTQDQKEYYVLLALSKELKSIKKSL